MTAIFRFGSGEMIPSDGRSGARRARDGNGASPSEQPDRPGSGGIQRGSHARNLCDEQNNLPSNHNSLLANEMNEEVQGPSGREGTGWSGHEIN